MEITGTQSIAAPRERVWEALNDAAVLRTCLPGCELVERVGDDAFKVVIAAAIGPLRARFDGSLSMTQVQAPESCVMVFQGQGGAVGFGKGSASVVLREAGENTELSYSARAEVGGKLAQVGSRLIDGVARKLSEDFFDALRRQLASLSATAPVTDKPPNAMDAEACADGDTESDDRPIAVPDARTGGDVTPSFLASVEEAQSVVPAWWLFVAAALGSATTLAGALLLR